MNENKWQMFFHHNPLICDVCISEFFRSRL